MRIILIAHNHLFRAQFGLTHQTFNVSGIPRVIVNNRLPGSIEISGTGSESEVSVDLILHEAQYLDWSITQNGDLIAVSANQRLELLNFQEAFLCKGRGPMFQSKCQNMHY